jgi:outer membrane cobalamin receptor
MRFWFVLILCLSRMVASGQVFTLSGKVLDQESKALPLAHIFLPETEQTFITDVSGDFSFKQPAGNVTLEITYTGYTTVRQKIFIKGDTSLIFRLQLSSEQLNEVVIEATQILQSDQLWSTRSSVLTLSEKEINAIPVLGGEADLIKTIQLLPGVSKGIEGTTDLFVRGGAADQNLILLDGAPVYNTGHLFGFLSVFNPDILESVESINGAFPANYGGRLSSILNVNTKSRLANKTMVSGNIGLLASRLMIRQPVLKDKLEVWVAGRRTYIDQVVKAVGESLPYFFYDLNAKVIYQPTTKDRLEFTHYGGEDVLNFERTARDTASNFRFTSDFTIANSSQTFLWERSRNENIRSVLRLYRTSFRYAIENQFEESRLFTNSNIQDWGGHWTLTQKLTDSFNQTVGVELVQHQVSPNVITTTGEIAQLLESSNTLAQKSLESSVYYQADGKFHRQWSWSGGLRLSSATINQTFYLNPEPRMAIHYRLNEKAALKASYSRMAQYIHRISSAAVAFPTDIWYPVTDRVVPQTADQWTLAFQQQMPRSNLFVSVETYYKNLQNLIGYREGTNLFLNTSFEDQLIQGVGKAYGVEVLIKKEKGKLTGWISYTLSKSLRQYDEVNQGKWFLSRYDRRHNGALVLNYELSKRFSLSGVFEFISGSRFTPVIGQYIVPSTTLGGVQLIPVYATINSVKLADAHRLDLGLKYQSSATKKFRSEWFVGVYNTYNRATPLGINIVPNEDGSFRYEQPGLFGLLPFISYGFKF